MKNIRLLQKQMFCGRLMVQKIANKSLKGDSGMTGNKRNTDRRQQELPVHKNGTNMDKLLQFLREEDEDGTLLPVFTLLLEVCFESQKHGFEKFKI